MAGAKGEVPDRAARPAGGPEPDPVGSEETDGGIEVVETPDLEEAIRERQGQPIPAALPVLPLKDTVIYPDTLTPLAVGQERSMRLVNDVLSGERMLALVASRDPELDEPGPGRAVRRGRRRDRRPDAQGPGRDASGSSSRGPSGCGSGDYVAEEPYLVARIEPLPDEVEPSAELEALTRNVQRTFTEIIEQIPVSAGGAPARGHQRRRPLGV